MPENIVHIGDELEFYKSIVEKKLGWGHSAAWRNQDFLALSDKVFEETGIMLSNTTLKRIWGKLEYNSMPNTQTLNALAQFIGFGTWLEFCAATKKTEAKPVQAPKNAVDASESKAPVPKQTRLRYLKWAGVLIVLAILFYSFSLIFQKKATTLDPETLRKVHFSSAPVADGIPNTVIFQYDVSQVPADTVLIQQNWDKRRQFSVAKTAREASSIYYWPGYYRAKLLIDGQVAKEHDLYIKSGGWLATLNTEKAQPRYFLNHELEAKPWLGVSEKILSAEQARAKAPIKLGFHYVEDFGELSSDNFRFEAAFRNTYSGGNGLCRFTKIMILCTDGVMVFPFSIPGCVGDLRLVCSERSLEGKDHDFSAFGCAFSDWENLKVSVQDKNLRIFLNDQLIQDINYQESAGRIVGMRFLFDGAGEIDNIRLSDEKGGLVFEENFGGKN